MNAQEASKPDNQTDLEHYKAELEQEWQAKLDYKEGEVESANVKLARISQNNIELKTKCDRLETANFELSQEHEQNLIRLQTLELELEMTKENSEREGENLTEQLASLR